MNSRKDVVIGIGGVTNGGKTTLANRLQKALANCTVIYQDDYFYPEDNPVWMQEHMWIPEMNYGVWDCEEALDMGRLVTDIVQWRSSGVNPQDDQARILLVEGFLLYGKRELFSLFDKKFFLTLPYEECRERRMGLTYIPPDPPGYFNLYAWPLYEKHKESVTDQTDIAFLDGLASPDKVFEIVSDEIRKFVSVETSPTDMYVSSDGDTGHNPK